MEKRLAIVTICFNDKEGLARTFASVFAQDMRDLQYVVIDGGSIDGSVQLIEAHADRIDKWTSEPDRGIYHAQNKGWYTADATFVLFLNAGDVLDAPDVIARTMPYLTDDVDIAYGDVRLSGGARAGEVKMHPERMTGGYLMKEVVAHASQFIRRSLLERHEGYDEQYRIAADYAFFAKAFWVQHARMRKVPFVVSRFDMGGLSSDPTQEQAVADERVSIQRRYAPWIWFKVYHGYAWLNRLFGR